MVTAATLALSGAAAVGFYAGPAAAAPAPVFQRASTGVTADALPTVQIDSGVVWSQAVVGNTVYAGGSFSNARPYGAAQGTNLTPRGDLLAYDITTGNLVSSFAPSLNGVIDIVAASPDGSRIYVGGDFTQAGTVGGPMQTRYRIAAYSTSTGQLVSSFAPSVSASVYSMVVTDSVVYVGGVFNQANGVARSRLAAFSASNGALLGWAPTADNVVKTMVMAPNGTHLVIGGAFTMINGATALGLGSISTTDGSSLPFAVASNFHDYYNEGAIENLATDGTTIYGTGYAWTSPSNFEGVFAADPNTGALKWLADCHGDGYGIYPSADAVYVVSHEHDCSNSGGFLNMSAPDSWYRTTAFTKQATGVVGHDSAVGYATFTGMPSPSLINWFPKLVAGTFTGTSQAAWSVAGNSSYVVEGGEFPRVNGIGQYGLVRFGSPSVAPNKSGPVVAGTADDPVVTAMSDTTARVAWQTNWDRDDKDLTYSVYRQDKGSTQPVWRRVVAAEFWNRPEIGFLDSGLTAGTTYSYWLTVNDPAGNTQRSDTVSVTMPTNLPDLVAGQYSQTVLNDGAGSYWRLDQRPGGSTAYDIAGGNDLSLRSGVSAGAGGATVDHDTASGFNGTSSGFGAGTVASIAPSPFSQEIWFASASSGSTSGGLMSFGTSATGNSSRYDHYLGLSNGRVTFRMYAGDFSIVTLTSARSYSDRGFHQAVATFSPGTGMALYVDGALVASNTTIVNSGNFSGYWRVGGEANSFFNGRLDDASVYPTVLTASQVQAHYAAASAPVASAPTASFTASATGLRVTVDGSGTTASQGTIANYAWDFGDGTTGSGVTTSHDYATAGTYVIRLTATGSNGGIGTTSRTVTVTSSNHPPVASFTKSCRYLTCTFDGSSSSDPDGTIASYAWDFGDGKTGTGSAPAHTFAAGGSYSVKLTVTDNKGASSSSTATVTTAADRPPSATFTQSCAALTCTFDASGSTDPDGTITSYAWAFGDGTTGSGVAPKHTYGAAGSYPVTLTVTDDAGATDVATASLGVQAPSTLAADSFARTVTSGWGVADTGGSWTPSGNAGDLAVTGGVGTMRMSTPGSGSSALLTAASASDVVAQVDAGINATPTGNGVFLMLLLRHSSGGDYRLKVRLLPSGVVHLVISKLAGGTETVLREVLVSGLTYTAGGMLSMQFTINATTLSGKVWAAGGAEPATAQISASDNTAGLQGAGSVGLQSYLAANATVTPVVASFDNLSATAPAAD